MYIRIVTIAGLSIGCQLISSTTATGVATCSVSAGLITVVQVILKTLVEI